MQYYITVSVCVYSMKWLKRQLAAQPSFFLGSVKCRVPRKIPPKHPGGETRGRGWEGRGSLFFCYGPSFEGWADERKFLRVGFDETKQQVGLG